MIDAACRADHMLHLSRGGLTTPGWLMLAFVLAVPAPQAVAQPLPRSFAELSRTLAVGKRIRIADTNNRITDAVVLAVRAEDIDVALAVGRSGRTPGPKSLTVHGDSVRWVAENDSTWNGELIGAGIGILAASLIIAATDSERSLSALVFLPPIGGVVGNTIDRGRRRMLYIAPARFPSATQIRGGLGAQVVTRFDF